MITALVTLMTITSGETPKILSPGGLKVNKQGRLLSEVSLYSGEWTAGSNILGLITFAIILGVSLAKLGEKGVGRYKYIYRLGLTNIILHR